MQQRQFSMWISRLDLGRKMKLHSPMDIWNLFKTLFPDVSKEVKQFRPHGGNAIILWFSDKGPFIFTIMPNKAWKLEQYKM